MSPRKLVPKAPPKVRTGWLQVDVFRAAHGRDCTGGGITSRVGELYVPHDDGPDRDPPGNLLLMPFSAGGVEHFRPWLVERLHVWLMFGGNFVWSTDARFRQRYGDHPVAVHDRFEMSERR